MSEWEWECEVCLFTGEPKNLNSSKEEWGIETSYECPHCESEYTNDCVSNRAEGEVCAFCGKFVEEVIELNLGGSDTDMVCRECEKEHWK